MWLWQEAGEALPVCLARSCTFQQWSNGSHNLLRGRRLHTNLLSKANNIEQYKTTHWQFPNGFQGAALTTADPQSGPTMTPYASVHHTQHQHNSKWFLSNFTRTQLLTHSGADAIQFTRSTIRRNTQVISWHQSCFSCCQSVHVP